MTTFEIELKVKVDGIIAGKIKQVKGGYQYQPKGSKLKGEVFATLDACKRSLTHG